MGAPYASVAKVLIKWIKLCSGMLLLVGIVSLSLGLTDFFFAIRGLVGIVSIAVGLVGVKTSLHQTQRDAKFFYVGLCVLTILLVAVNIVTLTWSGSLAGEICSQEVEVNNSNSTCQTIKQSLISSAVLFLLFGVCVLIPCTYISRRYYQALAMEGASPPLVIGQ